MSLEITPTEDTILLGEYMQVLRRRKWTILVVALIGVLLAGAYVKQATPLYASTSRVQATNPIASAQGNSANSAPNMVTEQSIVTSDLVSKCASIIMKNPTMKTDPTGATLNLDTADTTGDLCSTSALARTARTASLAQEVVVALVPQSSVMTITFTDPSAARAQIGAQAFALAYVHQKVYQANQTLEQLRTGPTTQQAKLTKDLAKVQSQIASTLTKISAASANGTATPAGLEQQFQNLEAQQSTLQEQLNNVNQILLNLDSSKIQAPELLLPAQFNASPVSPKKVVDGLLGLVGGLAIGILVAFLRERLDDTLRGRTDLEASTGAPVLAVIPRIPQWRKRHEALLITSEHPKSVAAEAYRTLRISISFAAVSRGVKTIMVSSAEAGEGKTTTAANLAHVLSDASKRVILVSADLRKPRIHRFFGLENNVGLSSILAGEAQVWEAIQDPGIHNLRIITSGPIPAKPAELLQSEQMADVLAGLAEVADFVLLDAAPILPVADALALAPLADAVLLVADASNGSRAAVTRASEQLDQVGVTLIGSVLNNLDPAKARAYRKYGYYSPYVYRYGYGYGEASAPTATNGEGRREGAPALNVNVADERNRG